MGDKWLGVVSVETLHWRIPSLNHDCEKKEDQRKYEQLKKYLSLGVQGLITLHLLMCEHLS